MLIYIVNPRTGGDRFGTWFSAGKDTRPTMSSDDPYHEYLDTERGSFRRSVNYWPYSPYGWHPVSWG